MPEKKTLERAAQDKREGKADDRPLASAAGPSVRRPRKAVRTKGAAGRSAAARKAARTRARKRR